METMTNVMRKISQCILPVAMLMVVSQESYSQVFDKIKYFQYNFENVVVNTTTLPGTTPITWNVRIIFSVTNPNPDADVPNTTWDIQNDAPYQSTGGSLTMDIGWDATEFTNTGSANPNLSPEIRPTIGGTGVAYPIRLVNINRATSATPARRCLNFDECPGAVSLDNRFWIETSVTPIAFTRAVSAGRNIMEGHPVCVSTGLNSLPGCPTSGNINIPVRSEVVNFAFLDTAVATAAVISDPRRPIEDFEIKCFACHNGNTPDARGDLIPRLAMHGANRNENVKVCVVCHNPNQTDVRNRTSGPETSVDFKRMIHGIHAGPFRQNPFIVVGVNGTVFDFSNTAFPASLRNCLNCHIDIVDGKKRKGTFELPLQNMVLGSTVNTGSTYADLAPGQNRIIDRDPRNDLKITPIAAVCSACHDSDQTRDQMMIHKGGASFSTTQDQIGVTVIERCVDCHGPGRQKDVRKVHILDGRRH